MSEGDRARIGVAIVRAAVGDDDSPVIRVLSMDSLFDDEHVLVVTRSPDEAATVVREWLRAVLRRGASSAAPNDGDDAVTPT